MHPRSAGSWLDPGAYGTLGVGGGFALGAKLVRPESEVWIIYGDGSCGYSIAEIDTFTRHKVFFCFFLRNDYKQQVSYDLFILDTNNKYSWKRRWMDSNSERPNCVFWQ